MKRSWTILLLTLLLPACPKSAEPEPPRVELTSVLRIRGEVPNGELGFRFADALDADGDGVDDLAAGARFDGTNGQSGAAYLWSGQDGSKLWEMIGTDQDSLLGQSVIMVPDIDGDKLADIVVAAPAHHKSAGEVCAYSPKSKAQLWCRRGQALQNLGWDMALYADADQDGHPDLLVGAPGGSGAVYILSAVSGATLRTIKAPAPKTSFGWRVSAVGDPRTTAFPPFVVGAPTRTVLGKVLAGSAYLVTGETGRVVHTWEGRDAEALFGEMVSGAADMDGDGHPDVAIGAPYTNAKKGSRTGAVSIYSSQSGRLLRRYVGQEDRELFGRMLARIGDVNGDGTEDLAIGAPWATIDGKKRAGRIEIRSGKDGKLLAQRAGTQAGDWFGWHIARGMHLGAAKTPGVIVSSVRHGTGDEDGLGALDVLSCAD